MLNKEKKNYYYISEGTELHQIEKEQGLVSYARVIEDLARDMVLCNNIVNIDDSVIYNMSWEKQKERKIEELQEDIDEMEDILCDLEADWEVAETEEKTKEIEELQKKAQKRLKDLEEELEEVEASEVDIFQYFLCNLNEFDIERLNKCGVITSYSDMLDCDVICVDHCGASWRIVPCDVYITHDWDLWQQNGI